MKSLYLIRHAKSSWADENLDDFDRPLNKRGKNDAPEMGRRLAKKIKADLIITSSAKRAQKTAELIADELDYPRNHLQIVDDLYASEAATLLQTICQTSDKINILLLVAHNPEITILAEFLATKSFENIPTCGIVAIKFATESWQEITPTLAKFEFFDYPKRKETDE